MIGFTTARALLVVIALHVLAALKRHVVDRDRLLERMWPGRTIMVTLLTALPSIARKGKARKAVVAKQAHKRRRGRGRAQGNAAVWTTNAATF